MNQQHLGSLLVLISAAGFATLPIFIKIAYVAGANTFTILTLRFMLAALFLWVTLIPLGISPRITVKNAVKLCLMGIIGYGSVSFLFTTSLQYLSASLAEMLLFTYPVLVSILTFVKGDEKFSWQKGVALLICVSGLFLILSVSFANISQLGIALALGSAIIYSCYIMISKSVLKNIHSLVAATYICSAPALVFTAYAWKTDQLTLTLSTSGWLALIGIASLGTVVGILGFFAGINRIGVSNASIVSTAEPVIAVLFSVFMLGEHLTLLQIVGALLIVASILVLQLCTNPDIKLTTSPYQLQDK